MQLGYSNSYVYQMNLNVQRDLGFDSVLTVAYVGELGHGLRTSPDLNLGPIGNTAGTFTASQRPFYSQFSGVTDIYNIESNGYDNFHSLQTTLVKRMGHGLSVQANYTWAHALGDNVGFSKGWQFNAIDVWETGQPFTISNSSSRTNTGISADRPNQLRAAHVQTKTLSRWFDTITFAAQPLGTLGSASRNSVYGPSFRHFDASAFKDFDLTERARLQLRCEAFNLSNTPNFGQPGATLGTSTFGIITALRTNALPRQLQLAARLSF